MDFGYVTPEEELDDLYVSLHNAIDNLEDLEGKSLLEEAQNQAIIIVRGVDRIQELLNSHPNRRTLERQIGGDLAAYRAQAGKSIFSCKSRDYDVQEETPESIAFWQSLYEHTTVPY